jgi:hypothetical protein
VEGTPCDPSDSDAQRPPPHASPPAVRAPFHTSQTTRAVDPLAWFFEDPFFGASTSALLPRAGRDALSAVGGAPTIMKVDIKESDAAFEVHADVPGVRKVRACVRRGMGREAGTEGAMGVRGHARGGAALRHVAAMTRHRRRSPRCARRKR